MRKTQGALLAALFVASTATAWGADHRDGPAAQADPSTDLTDLYVWNVDATHVAMVMNVSPNASTASKFSDQALYAFHTTSKTSFGATAGNVDQNLVCQFSGAANPQSFKCWVGGELINGTTGNKAGYSSLDGKVKIFAGLRADPFFFNLKGFQAAVRVIMDATAGLTFDANMCPNLDIDTAVAVQTALTHTDTMTGTTPDPAKNDFAGQNVLSIVVTVDKTLLTPGPILGVWASTNRNQ